ncbi:MAG: outer membrane protein assembly factor BamE [Gammaproteobacteria bacterium]|nr:outer membrane protein assembly factor BamE [Gammaproteobacteria bacterium]
MKLLRLLLVLATATLCGCVYHQPFEQGNILSPAKTQSIHTGMTSEDVVAKIGAPVLENIYANNRLVYVYTKQPKRNKTNISRFIVTFQNNRVVDIKTDMPKIPN